MKRILPFLLLLLSVTAFAQPRQLPVGAVLPTRQVPVHDPVMIKEKDTYYLFCTGFGISVWSSKDLQNWRKEAPVFAKAPQWAVDTIPGFRGHIWAPDISYHNGQYYLYYSVSAFGKNTSAIGVATTKTLDSASKYFGWTDHGRVIQSYPGKTNWNAIDPNIITDKKGTPFMVFGSFWDGLKMVQLTKDWLHTAEDVTKIPTVASRKPASSVENPPSVDNNPKDAGGNAIEAPFVFKKGSWYYFFASIDYCCKGEQSTYKMIVGRSKNVKGPFLDKAGKDIRTGGGTIVLQGDKEWHGVGHNSAYTFDGKDYLVFHGYDAADKGASKLRIEEMRWEDGWPVVAK
ncbi:arabinan endo-1,5-alpha-L-arabinosidase [Cnuella takakiae]|uniref:Arabinan endo-1,5-alpha-L-arabinosidase n=1 Tax=Cnuella takakiae TaxID=1302690 RepID=A0A1M5B0B8_9BACT|nr:arabinan endo-1,5-alpha-L-arabinosidase [Cnuella takakiae]OLY93282.1 arabinan endo-1,5-alpha-L-arabinosidase [Cnuella takakiae]SHF35612.1 arabinan endo-1,5-alpha-L-arabinosidase [Cnuella takakiae]